MSNGHASVHDLSIVRLQEWLIEYNEQVSCEYTSPDSAFERRQYRAKHETEIIAFECMDGRLNLALMSETPLGIIQSVRNLGGIFNLGWFYLNEMLDDLVGYAVKHGRDCLAFATYHWSRGDLHRGCRGHNYDKDVARIDMMNLTHQIEEIFGAKHSVVYPICLGIETDEDAFLFHGLNGRTLDVSTLHDPSSEELRIKLMELYPDMKKQVLDDLLPLVEKNVLHVAKIRAMNRQILDAHHRERLVGVGRGFEWLHVNNLALIVGPFDPNLDAAIEVAAKLLLANIEAKRIPQDGIILLASETYRDASGSDKPGAMVKSRFARDFALKTIELAVPSLRELVIPMACVVDVNTRKLHLI